MIIMNVEMVAQKMKQEVSHERIKCDKEGVEGKYKTPFSSQFIFFTTVPQICGYCF